MIKPTRIHAIFPGGFQEFIGVTDVRDEPKGRKSVCTRADCAFARIKAVDLTYHRRGSTLT